MGNADQGVAWQVDNSHEMGDFQCTSYFSPENVESISPSKSFFTAVLMKTLRRRPTTNALGVLGLTVASLLFVSFFAGDGVDASAPQSSLTISGQVREFDGTPVPNVTMTFR